MAFGFGRDKNKTTQELADEIRNADPVARSVELRKGNAPAVDRKIVLTKGGDELTKAYDKAGIALSKHGMEFVKAQAVMILDHSMSMRTEYSQGKVQTLVRRALGFALQIDADGEIPVIPFDSRLWPTVTVDIANHADIVNQSIYRPNDMGGTVLAPALEVVRDMARITEYPLYVVIVTDDNPQDRDQVQKIVDDLKRFPVFVKVLTLVDAAWWKQQDEREVPGLVDNLNAQVVRDPAGLSDLEFANKMAEEWRTWAQAARAQGILT